MTHSFLSHTQTYPCLDLLSRSNHPNIYLLEANKLHTIIVPRAMTQAAVPSCRASEKTDQLPKRQRLESVLAVTLPFKQENVSPTLFELAINQTQKRWAWFTESRELDNNSGTELGTLGYLPWEIRQEMFKAVHDGYFYGDCDLAPRTLCYEIQDPLTGPAPDIFDLDSYHPLRSGCYTSGGCYTSWGSVCLRLSSATLGFEYDVLFLSNTIFKFECRTGLEKFLDQLSDFHQTMLRRIIISIWVPMVVVFVCGKTGGMAGRRRARKYRRRYDRSALSWTTVDIGVTRGAAMSLAIQDD